MKRIVLAFLGTVAGLVALLSFKSHSPTSGVNLALPPAGGSAGSAGSQSSSAPSAGGSSGSGSGGSGAGNSSSQGSSKSSSSSGQAGTQSINGTAVETPYGVVQIKLTVNGQKITDVSYVQLTAYDGRSQEINSYAAPILVQETLSAQSANINAVSGATFTSEGYAQSLQSALDQAGIK